MSAPRRAYVLIEALVGGALVATVLLALVAQVGAARDRAVLADRHAVAVQVALLELEARRALAYGNLSVGSASSDVAVGGARYRTAVDVSAGAELVSVGSLSSSPPYKHISVVVSYGIGVMAHAVSVESRTYEQPTPPVGP